MATTTTTTMKAARARFRQVYADAVKGVPEDDGYKNRSLHWHGPRVSLAAAAELYAEIQDGYNAFSFDTIAKLAAAFPDAGIEATCAREGSVAIYLHVPADCICVAAWIEMNLSPDETDFVTEFSCLQDGEVELEGEALRVWWD